MPRMISPGSGLPGGRKLPGSRERESNDATVPVSTDLSSLGLDIVDRVEASALESVPFDHLYLDGIFSRETYDRLLDHLPETGRYRELRHREALRPDGRSARRKFYLFPEHIALLPPAQRAVWLEVSRVLRSPALQDAFKRKFRRALEGRFSRSVERLTFYPVPMLLRDLGGYRIGIHGDSVSKAITVQFYLPRDESQARLGTLFHEGRDGEAARRFKALAFRPATGYAFPVVYHATWHSVAPTSDADGERNSLMLTYYVQNGVVDRLAERAKRLWVFLAYAVRR
jgi:hypothetical protein